MRRIPLPSNFIWDSYLDTPNQQWLRVNGKTVACVSFHNGKWRSRVNIHLGDYPRERIVEVPNRELGAAWAERWAMARWSAGSRSAKVE